MQRLHFRESSRVAASLLAATGIALTACGSSGGGSGSTTPATHSASSTSQSSAPAGGAEPTGGNAAVAVIKKNWVTFFNAKTPTSRRIALLQDGERLAAVLNTQSHSSLAASASAKVTHVTLTGTNQASVTYSIYVAGQNVLPNQQGVAVYQNGIWKVGLVSFCGLLRLENLGKSSGLPPACKG
ncbi:MAG TPA: hypothetical protein VF983_14965 [Streptosporangiaceae bacterium]